MKDLKLAIGFLCFILLVCSCNKQDKPESSIPESEEYTIIYDLEGGLNNEDNPTKYTAANLPLAIKDPYKEGFDFAGWVSEELGVDIPNKNIEIPLGTKDCITLTAVFQDPSFDFAELPESDFPRGVWTVNQLNEKYGEPQDVRIEYLEGQNIVIVHVNYEDISISSGYEELSNFSFDMQDVEGRDFDLSKEDKDVTFNILRVARRNNDVALPRNIQLGVSSKEQVIASYPAGTTRLFPSEMRDIVWMSYNVRDKSGELSSSGGSMNYIFDENDLLKEVEALYWVTSYYGHD